MKLRSSFLVSFVLSSFFTLMSLNAPISAGELDSASKDALEKTQHMLTTPSERERAFGADSNAKKAGDQVKGLHLQAADEEKVYKISSDVFQKIVQDSAGDSVKAQELMEKATKDPNAFYESLSPEQKKQIKDLSNQIEKDSNKTNTSRP